MRRPRNKIKEIYLKYVYSYLQMSNRYAKQGDEEKDMKYFTLYIAKRRVFIVLVAMYECMLVEQVEDLICDFEYELRKEEEKDDC